MARPKQLKHWLSKLNLKIIKDQSSKHLITLKGRGRYWFINEANQFVIAERYIDFDLWDNSMSAFLPLKATTFQQFSNFIERLETLADVDFEWYLGDHFLNTVNFRNITDLRHFHERCTPNIKGQLIARWVNPNPIPNGELGSVVLFETRVCSGTRLHYWQAIQRAIAEWFQYYDTDALQSRIGTLNKEIIH